MIHQEFILKMELYYEKKYNEFENKKLLEYLFKKFNPKEIDILENLIFSHHEKKWKTNPDIACIQKIVDEYNKDFQGIMKEYGLGKGNIEYKNLLEQNKVLEIEEDN